MQEILRNKLTINTIKLLELVRTARKQKLKKHTGLVFHYKCFEVFCDMCLQIPFCFRKLAMKMHPDRGGDTEQFKLLGEAYEVMKNACKLHAICILLITLLRCEGALGSPKEVVI